MKVIENFIDVDTTARYLELANQNAGKFKHSDGFRRRMGVNGVHNLSDYYVLKRWDWSVELRRELENNWPVSIKNTNYNEVWFLRFNEGGKFDKFIAGTDLGNIVSIPLNDGGKFVVEENGESKTYTNKAGSAYVFNLTEPHEVPETQQQDTYLVFLTVDTSGV